MTLLRARESYKSHDWVSAATQLLSGADYLKAMGVRLNALPTPSRGKGRPEMSPVCQDCQDYAALGHISQTCSRGCKLRPRYRHGKLIKRHDDIAKFLCGRLRKRGWQVIQEPVIPYGRTWRRPDMVVWREGDSLAMCSWSRMGFVWKQLKRGRSTNTRIKLL